MKFMVLLFLALAFSSDAEDPSCDFEKDLCGWTQSKSDNFDWKRQQRRTPSSSTGPSSGQGNTGYYVYIETSCPRRLNDSAILTFTGSNSSGLCFSFYYHMYGNTTNTLNIYSRGQKVWSKSGNQGNVWKRDNFSIGAGRYDLKIEGIRGQSYTGDIAVDSISVSSGPCSGVLPTTSLPPGPPAPVTCGISAMTRVIGGVDARPGNWPWQIVLLLGGGFTCGGSLIAPDWIVTAAHCIASSQPPSSYSIRVGDHNRQLNEGTEETVQGKEIIPHPEFGKPSFANNDIALIRLVRPVKLGPRIGTVCLPDQGESVPISATCYITGWGMIQYPGPAHNILQQAKLPPVSNEECARKLAQSPGGGHFKITDTMICAGIEGKPQSGCFGDSGGPYVCQSSSGKWFLQGAVSWGSLSCDASDRYSVFARVAQFRDWIRQHTGV
ncbi:chymotrypsinogen B-like [Acropora muricata]|uniref:chymotrypsinogen B-like n=1 Tax=Acropora muricata TaxID=159855 RepID=UPI0034E430A0